MFFFGAKKGATGIPSSNGNDNAQNRNYAAIEFGESIFPIFPHTHFSFILGFLSKKREREELSPKGKIRRGERF